MWRSGAMTSVGGRFVVVECGSLRLGGVRLSGDAY